MHKESEIEQAAASQEHFSIIDKWKTRESSNWSYFDVADDKDWIATFWSQTGRYKRFFDRLDTKRLIEIACGRGRHSRQIIESCQKLWLVDSSIDALKDAKISFREHDQVEFILSDDGLSLRGVPTDTATAVFSLRRNGSFRAFDGRLLC
jgi:ubiquinone/menaquinone biosynthesis C-methylase UbiE